MAKRPVVLVVMDGIGLSDNKEGNAVAMAYKPNLDWLWENCPHTTLRAHGLAVGLPTDKDMGNSEVGHNAIGSGQIYSQGAKLVNENIETGELYNSATWKKLIKNVEDHDGTLHFIGLLSDGNVHSHINHLKALIEEAKKEGVKKVRVHALLDGRDVPETSALEYIDDIENFMNSLNDETFDAQIASGGGRMQITMDRYESNWPMVAEGWDIHVHGKGREFKSATEAIETYRKELGVIDQDLPGFVLVDENGKPKGTIEDGDSVILYNFRGDRAQELSLAFDQGDEFTHFDRGRKPEVEFAGMLQYDADAQIPKQYLTEPPKIHYTLTEELVKAGINEYAISETQKYGHVTYFWNGNRAAKFDEDLEVYDEIESDVIPFEQRPWMKSAQITDKLIEALKSGQFQFLRTNFPNGDMVGHTGDLEATIIGVESVDLAIGRIKKAVDETNAVLMITADHGNADEMLEKPKKPGAAPKSKTSHTLNKVPFIIYNYPCTLKQDDQMGLSDIAATVCQVLGVKPNEHWNPSIIESEK